MAEITGRWAGFLRSREQEDTAEPNTFSCPICQSEIKTLDLWRTHVEKASKHRDRWHTEQAIEDAYKEYGRQSNEPDTPSSPSNRKEPGGDLAPSPTGAEGETREAKCRSPPPPGSQRPATSPNNRSRARIEFDQGRPCKNTSGRQLWTPEDGLHPKTAPSQRRAVPVSSPRQQTPSNKAARPPQAATQSPPDDDDSPTRMMRQPETRPISQDQLVAEVKGIYAGLAMVETKCIEMDNAQSS
ncbi:hypothetical protein FDECE_10729, partial [Fusarium decemcellulare]